MINEKRVLEEFLELVQIRCSTKDEREVADLLTQRLQAARLPPKSAPTTAPICWRRTAPPSALPPGRQKSWGSP
ncbi:MAG: hypothetical protein IJU00_00075 [Selenomonas sp.]|nr:hypothetical protein [Selenomonas sp.]